MVPIFGLTFWEAIAVGLGLGLLLGLIGSLIVWFILGMENPPFQDLQYIIADFKTYEITDRVK